MTEKPGSSTQAPARADYDNRAEIKVRAHRGLALIEIVHPDLVGGTLVWGELSTGQVRQLVAKLVYIADAIDAKEQQAA